MRALTLRRSPVWKIIAVSAFGLVFAACASADDAPESPVVRSTAPAVEVTVSSVPGTSSTTVAAPPTSEVPDIVATTPNMGDLQIIVPVGVDGQMPADTVIGCRGGTSFPVSALDEAPLLVDSGLVGVEEAIRPFLESGEGAFWPQDGWQVLHQTDDRVLLVYTDGTASEPQTAFMGVERDGGEWRWAGSSTGDECPLEVKVPGDLNAVDWRLDPSADPLTSESTVVHVLVTERKCASGQPVGDRLLGPEVVVTDTEILIAFAAQPQSGAQTCPSNPEEPFTIELSGPVGTRAVTDGLALDESLADVLEG